MPTKRKASSGATGSSKRIASGLATPASVLSSNVSSDDDYTEDGALSDDEVETRLIKKFSGVRPYKGGVDTLGLNDPVSTLFQSRVDNQFISKDFGKSLNQRFEGQETLPSSIRIQNFHGTYADYVITVS